MHRRTVGLPVLLSFVLAPGVSIDSPNVLKIVGKECQGKDCFVDASGIPRDLTDTDYVVFELGDGGTRTFLTKTKGTGKTDSWRGQDGIASMNLLTREVVTEDGDRRTLLFGTMSDEETIYKISPDANGNSHVTETLWANVDPEAEELWPPDNIVRDRSSERTLENFPVKRKLSPHFTSRPRFEADDNGHRRKLYDDNGGNIDIMVVFTREAECVLSGLGTTCAPTTTTTANMLGTIELAVEETNEAYDESGVLTQLRLVHAYREESYSESNADPPANVTNALKAITNPNDGNMDDVHTKRLEYGADLVVLVIVGRGSAACGGSFLGPSFRYMFSVTRLDCLTGGLTFGHEIGHNMGCMHDRGSDGQCGTTGYNYGWRDTESKFRTMLSLNCNYPSCDNSPEVGCQRIKRISNPDIKYNGRDLGDAFHDNVRQINENRAIIAGYVSVADCGESSDCDDGDPCTADVCNTLAGECTYEEACFTNSPTVYPSAAPSVAKSKEPSGSPTVVEPSMSPTVSINASATLTSSGAPTATSAPTLKAHKAPTGTPSWSPTMTGTDNPTVIASEATRRRWSWLRRNACLLQLCGMWFLLHV